MKTGSLSDTTPPSDIIVSRDNRSWSKNVLIWINPHDEDFNEVSIIRKAGSAPSN